ncbi:helix-turn-helix domain-containing protein [Streptomyces sp. NPDC056411]|uniref:helix-turn-helix domain-containing protein n=1 Tax=Streptomyces sp. NPDC056411 TaxID=3345813 RepID=UPI0035E3A150
MELFHEESVIGERIARLRTRRKLTQEGLAERAGLCVDLVRKLEQGVRQTARLSTLNALARALEVEPSALVGQPAGALLPQLIRDAQVAARATDRLDYATPFGPTNVGVAKVNFLVEMAESAEALRTTRTIPALHSLPPTWRARFHVDRALACADLHRGDGALQALLSAERTAPEWMRYHATGRRLVAELRNRERRRTSPLTELAGRLGLDGQDTGRTGVGQGVPAAGQSGTGCPCPGRSCLPSVARAVRRGRPRSREDRSGSTATPGEQVAR